MKHPTTQDPPFSTGYTRELIETTPHTHTHQNNKIVIIHFEFLKKKNDLHQHYINELLLYITTKWTTSQNPKPLSVQKRIRVHFLWVEIHRNLFIVKSIYGFTSQK